VLVCAHAGTAATRNRAREPHAQWVRRSIGRHASAAFARLGADKSCRIARTGRRAARKDSWLRMAAPPVAFYMSCARIGRVNNPANPAVNNKLTARFRNSCASGLCGSTVAAQD
jgi:hypothetical protein